MAEQRIIVGDCIEAMKELPDDSVHAVVTDPPYGIGFMGHEWDQPGEFGPVTANGTPGPYASGRPYPGRKGGQKQAKQRAVPSTGTPSGQRRRAQPKPSGFDGDVSVGDHTKTRDRASAMHAGRYDLSLTANRRFQGWCEAWATEAFRVLKPGGFILSFGGTRTFHRLACAVEDAGFEVRDALIWLYGSGFPKSLDVGKAIDKAAGAKREVVRERTYQQTDGGGYSGDLNTSKPRSESSEISAPSTDEAKQWDGWGTALKPGHEPIVCGRKPLIGTVVDNVLAHGTGAMNIGAGRISTNDDLNGGAYSEERQESESAWATIHSYAGKEYEQPSGRWPSNVLLSHTPGCVLVGTQTVDVTDEEIHGEEVVEVWACAEGCPVDELDRQSGQRRGGGQITTAPESEQTKNVYGDAHRDEFSGYSDVGGASRFFYVAKSGTGEREAGLINKVPCMKCGERDSLTHTNEGGREVTCTRNPHPTVKPIEIMRQLVRLVVPPGGTVLDPFTGSGTTGCAAAAEGRNFIGIEREDGTGESGDNYVIVAESRMAFWSQHEGASTEKVLGYAKRLRLAQEAGQLGLLS